MGVMITAVIEMHKEASRKDRQEAVLELARQQNASDLEALVSDAKLSGEAKDVAEAMGRVVREVRLG